MPHNCRTCGVHLVVGENITQYRMNHYQYICHSCKTDYDRSWHEKHPDYDKDWTHITGRNQPMNKNRQCSVFLGVAVAEQVLASVFKNVQRMPYGNPGFDFRCNGGYMIDVKSSCKYHSEKCADRWGFHINKNKIAEYFLCLAFDNRESLNPEHIWLIPAGDINDHIAISISETRLDKWDRYEFDIERIIVNCNILKEETWT